MISLRVGIERRGTGSLDRLVRWSLDHDLARIMMPVAVSNGASTASRRIVACINSDLSVRDIVMVHNDGIQTAIELRPKLRDHMPEH